MQPHGGFWLRFVAYIIDAVILNVVSWVIMMVAGRWHQLWRHGRKRGRGQRDGRLRASAS